MAALKVAPPLDTADPKALDAVSLGMKVKGGVGRVAVSDGRLGLDGSTLTFSAVADRFSPLDMKVNGELDQLDLDRYLPKKASASGQSASRQSRPQPGMASGVAKGEAVPAVKTDYQPLRKLVVDASMTVGKLQVAGAHMEHIKLHLTGRDGIFRITPLAMDLYQGSLKTTATANVQGSTPRLTVAADGAGIQVGPLLRDLLAKDVLAGTVKVTTSLTTQGATPAAVKKNLDGKGELLFTDGAIVGIDLASMVRNVQASFSGTQVAAEKPRTDFSELRAPFTVSKGVVNTVGTSLQSPLLRVVASGSANLVTSTLDMRVQPKVVATLKGQGDTEKHQGVMVPVVVGGTFDAPTFRPDLAGMLKQQLPSAETLKKTLEEQLAPGDKSGKKKPSLEQSLKGLLPKF